MEQIKVHFAALGSQPVIYLMDDDPDKRLLEQVIDCGDIEVIGKVWLVPDVKDEHLVGYEPIGFTTLAAKPSEDSVLTIHIRFKLAHSDGYIAVADDTELSIIGEKCNECCGTLPEIPAPTVPEPIICTPGCGVDVDGVTTYTYTMPIPANPNGLQLRLRGWFNGAVAAPAPAEAGYANAAAILVFANTDVTGWGAYGEWTLEDVGDAQVLQLVSTTVTCAYFPIDLLEAVYCLPVPEVPADINSIVLGGETVTFPAVSLNRTTPEIAVQAIAPFMIGTLEVVQADDPAFAHIRYTGFQLPTDLKNDAVVVASFAAGACPE